MNFETFLSTARYTTDIGSEVQDDSLDGVAGYMFHGGLYVEATPDGFHLHIERGEWDAKTLTELAAILYGYALGDAIELPDDVCAFVSKLIDSMGLEDFGKALLLNMTIPGSGICYMQDFCDANQCALDAVGDHGDDTVDMAAALYDRARPYIRGRGA